MFAKKETMSVVRPKVFQPARLVTRDRYQSYSRELFE
jgi:hypothetical protein